MPKRYRVMDRLTEQLVRQAVMNAAKNHRGKKEVEDWLGEGYEERVQALYDRLRLRNKMSVNYSYKEITCVNGKERTVARSNFADRVLLHTLMLLIKPFYDRRLTWHSYNCIEGRGINSKSGNRRGDPIREIKRIINTEKPMYYLQLDIRKCYENTSIGAVKTSLEDFIKDNYYIDTVLATCLCEHGLPIGAPTSPMLQHIVMMRFMYWYDEQIRLPMVTYADDILIFGNSKKELHKAYWRIRCYLWYVFGYELKKRAHPKPIDDHLDILGVVFHSDGHTKIRKSTKERARKAWHNPLSRASYLGVLRGADSNNLIKNLDMTESELFDGDDMLVERRMSSPLVKIEDIGENKDFYILDFELRQPKLKQDGTLGKAWFRMQIAVEDKKRLIKGCDPSICLYFERFLIKVRKLAILEDKSEVQAMGEAMALLKNRAFQFEHRPDGWCFKGTVRNEE